MNYVLKEVPENMEELKRKATNQSNWRERLEAVNELKNYDCQQSRSILTNLAIHDSVFVVQEAAFRAAQSMKITKNGATHSFESKTKRQFGKRNQWKTGDGSQFIAGGIHAG